MLFRKKKEDVQNGNIFLAKGIYLKQPQMNSGHIIKKCLMRCGIIFLLVFGSIGGFLSAFDISYNYLLVIGAYLALSMYFSVLYALAKPRLRDVGYIFFFGLFIVAIYLFKLYANSGFYAIVNIILQRAKTFFELSGVREYETQIHNDYLTIAVVAVFVGMVQIIVLNIWLSSAMSVFWTAILTFPILLIPIYMKQTPDALYMFLLIAGYLAVMVFKANGHYTAFAWEQSFRVKGLKKDRIMYTQDDRVCGQMLALLIIAMFCIVVLTQSVFSEHTFAAKFKQDRLRETTAESIGNFILLGFDGLFNRYDSVGGMSGGQLGGISNVRTDYLPDLRVSFTPYNNEAVYLKGFTGGAYGDNCWEDLYERSYENAASQTGDQKRDTFREDSLMSEAKYLQYCYEGNREYTAKGKMDIRNVGADESYLYYPYYTVFEDYSPYDDLSMLRRIRGIKLQEEVSYTYYPKVVWEASYGGLTPRDMGVPNVDAVFLEVPEKNQEVINQECLKIGLHTGMSENEVVEAVKDYFEENIPYTLKPGATPKNQDFINYFLTKNRKGYCAHFASAATLIFRTMGIPARYVEGYAFSLEAVLASDVKEEKQYSDYYDGYSDIGESAVMEVEVTDAMAHAWVEIYISGFGWKVVEVTPGSNETTDEEDFWSAFTDFMDATGGLGVNGENNGFGGNLKLSEYKEILYLLFGIAICLWLLDLSRIMVRKGKRYRLCHQKEETEAVIARYTDICDCMRLSHVEFAKCKSHKEQLVLMKNIYQPEFDVENIVRCLERISFSHQGVTEKEAEQLSSLFKEIKRRIWINCSLKEKIKLIRR